MKHKQKIADWWANQLQLGERGDEFKTHFLASFDETFGQAMAKYGRWLISVDYADVEDTYKPDRYLDAVFTKMGMPPFSEERYLAHTGYASMRIQEDSVIVETYQEGHFVEVDITNQEFN